MKNILGIFIILLLTAHAYGAVTASSNSPVCVGNTINLHAVGGIGASYYWHGPAGFISILQNPTIPSATLANAGVYTVVETILGVKDSTTITVVVIPNPPIPIITDTVLGAITPPICTGQTLDLKAQDTAGATYFWSGPNGFTSFLQNPTIPSITLAGSGIYSVVVTFNGCQSENSINITVQQTPPVPVIGVIPPVCSGQNINLNATDTPLANYIWTGPNGFSSTLQNPTITGAINLNQGNYTVTVNYFGCAPRGPATVFVIIDSTPVATIASNSPICQGKGNIITNLGLSSTSSVPGSVFSWSGPNAFTSSIQNPSLSDPEPPNAGTYCVLVTKIYGSFSCKDSVCTPVQIIDTPTRLAVFSNTFPVHLCAGSTLILTALNGENPPLGNYFWNSNAGPSGNFSSTQEDPTIPFATPDYTGLYSVYYYIQPWCPSDTAYTMVYVDTMPSLPTISYNTPICVGDTLKLTSTDAISGLSYTWTGPHGFSSTQQNPMIPNVSLSNSGTYSVTVNAITEPAPCFSSFTTNIGITNTPNLSVSNNSPLCEGDTLKFNAITDPGATVQWTGPYAFQSNINAPQRAPVLLEYGGIYTIVTVSPSGCTDTVRDTVTVHKAPPAPSSPYLTYCQTFDAPPLQAVGNNVLWYTSSAPGTIGSPIAPTPATNLIGGTFYYLNSIENGCKSPMDSTLIIINPKPFITTTQPFALCPGDTTTIGVMDTGNIVTTFHWAPPLYLNDTTLQYPLATPISNVTYTVVATNSDNCKDTAYTNIVVHPAAVVYIPAPFDYFGDSILLFPGDTIQFHIQTNCTSFSWFPPQTLSDPTASNPVASPTNSTKYIVTATTEYGCTVQDSISVYIKNETVLDIPNAFTPGNGPNNIFKVIKRGIATLRYFRVYDRWGALLFETNNIDQGWDGEYKGKPQPFGVYIYDIDAVPFTRNGTSQDVFYRGNVTLLR